MSTHSPCEEIGRRLQPKFRDSLTEMDSRFRGNDVISARRVAFRLAVIPAKAGIHRLIQAF